MTEGNSAQAWNLRLGTLATVGAASAYLLIGAGVVQSDNPAATACMTAGGLGMMAYSTMLGGLGLIASWVLAVIPLEPEILWEGKPRFGIPAFKLETRSVRPTLMMFAVVGVASSLIMTSSTMFAGTTVAHQIAAGKCSEPPISSPNR